MESMPKNKTDTPLKSSLVTQFLDLNENHDRKQSEQKKKKKSTTNSGRSSIQLNYTNSIKVQVIYVDLEKRKHR